MNPPTRELLAAVPHMILSSSAPKSPEHLRQAVLKRMVYNNYPLESFIEVLLGAVDWDYAHRKMYGIEVTCYYCGDTQREVVAEQDQNWLCWDEQWYCEDCRDNHMGWLSCLNCLESFPDKLLTLLVDHKLKEFYAGPLSFCPDCLPRVETHQNRMLRAQKALNILISLESEGE